MSLPTTTIEMTRAGNKNEPPLVIREPVTLEPKNPQGARPRAPFGALTDTTRGHLIAMIGEYLGTFMFLFFSFVAAQTGNQKTDTTLQAPAASAGLSLIQISYISAVFGLSLATNVFVWYRVSGGMFNPSISFGLWLAGAFDWVRLACVIPAQFLGGITAAGLASGVVPGKLQAENSLGPNVSRGQGFVMEALLTAMLMLTILMLAVEKHRASFLAPLPIGIALLLIHLIGINVSGASVNPARTLGPALVNGSYVPEMWIYFVAPTLGAAMAAGVHGLLKALAYQTANPGQDGDGMEYYRVMPPKASPGGGAAAAAAGGVEKYNYSVTKTSSHETHPSYTTLPHAPAVRYPTSRREIVVGKDDNETVILHESRSRVMDKDRHGAGGMTVFD